MKIDEFVDALLLLKGVAGPEANILFNNGSEELPAFGLALSKRERNFEMKHPLSCFQPEQYDILIE